MFRALLYLRLHSLLNLAVQRVSRLRQPKYLIGTGAAVAYFWFFLIRRTYAPGPSSAIAAQAISGVGTAATALICAALCLLALGRIAFAWIAPADKPGLRFTEAEIAFLFPAPITRKALIHFRLLSAQFAILFTSVLIALFFNRSGYLGGHRAIRVVGWWVILSTFDLHLSGTNLALSRLREKYLHFRLIRLAVVTTIVLYAAAVFFSAFGRLRAFASDFGGDHGMPEVLLGQLVDAPAFHWLTLPFRIVLAPYFASGPREFLVAIVPALLVLALHYYWVSSSQARFEEGSIALAEKRAAVREAALRGELPQERPVKPAKAGPFPLSEEGPPEIAFLWKNLLSMRNALFSRRVLIIFLMLMIWAAAALGPLSRGSRSGGGVIAPIVVIFSAMIAAYAVLLGPQIARQDLRGDLANADILKTYPLEGWRLALGELLAPTLLLTVVLWCAIIACSAAFDAGGSLEWLTPGVRITVALSMASAAPFLCLIQLIVPNSIVVLLPGWYQSSRSRAGGIEMFGQRLVFGVVQLFFALLVAVPAAGAAALVIFCSKWVFGVGPSVVLAALAVLAILASEAVLGVWWLGERFEKFDLSAESR